MVGNFELMPDQPFGVTPLLDTGVQGLIAEPVIKITPLRMTGFVIRALTQSLLETGRSAPRQRSLERFQEKWIPVFRQETR